MNVSVVIPVLNEGLLIARAVHRAWQAGSDEVIVSDGGSTDATLEIVESENCKLIRSPRGRGIQMNAGAKVATGVIFLFLHADTWLEPGGCDQIRAAFDSDGSRVGGAFRQRIENRKPLYRLIERGNSLRAKWMETPFGDQGIFIKRDIFQSLGGFPDVPLMEDYIFSKMLKKIGRPLLLPGPIHVNARRWEKNGPLRQTIRNWSICLSYRMGVQPSQLAKWYV